MREEISGSSYNGYLYEGHLLREMHIECCGALVRFKGVLPVL